MTVDFRESFSRDLRAVKDKAILTRVKEVIEKVIECESLIDVPNVKRMKGNPGFYRIRIGDYRVGLMVEGEVVTFVTKGGLQVLSVGPNSREKPI